MMRTQAAVLALCALSVGCEKDPRSIEAPPRPAAKVTTPPTAAAPAMATAAPSPATVPTTKPTPEPTIASTLPTLVPAPREPAPRRAPRPAISAPIGPTEEAPPRTDENGIPIPPTVEPAAYAAWRKALPASSQKQIARFCRQHPQDFQAACGGIGPLHIPYPPYPRLRVMGREDGGPVSLFASASEWRASLTSAQRRYVDRECAGDEDRPSSDLCGDNTPLVVAFEDQAIQFTAGTQFAFQPGAPTATDWPTATTPWIALDRDADGVIDRGAELFGSDTVLPEGGTAANGFLALAALDANHDSVIDARDPAFARLVLWADRDADGRSSPGELAPLAATIVSISLANRLEPRCDARGNCEGERSALTWRDAQGATRTGSVVDVYLPRR